MKYKNCLLIDFKRNKIIFDHKRSKKEFKNSYRIEKNAKLWQEIIFHCNNLEKLYFEKYQRKSNLNENMVI